MIKIKAFWLLLINLLKTSSNFSREIDSIPDISKETKYIRLKKFDNFKIDSQRRVVFTFVCGVLQYEKGLVL